MAELFEITDGSTTIDLMDSSSPFTAVRNDGLPGLGFDMELSFNQSGFADGGGVSGYRHPLMVRNYNLVLSHSSHNNIATLTQTLYRLLLKATRYHTSPTQLTPVYIRQQTKDETKTRYSLVYGFQTFNMGSPFQVPFRYHNLLMELGVDILQSPFWTDTIPGNLPGSAMTLDETDGPSSPVLVHVSNHLGDAGEDITHIYRDDGGVFTSNFVSSSVYGYLPPTPAVGDHLYIGAATPFHSIVLNVGTAGVFVLSGVWEISEGSDVWQTLTTAAFEGSVGGGIALDETVFEFTGNKVINIHPDGADSWALQTINGQSRFWLRFRVTAFTSQSTTPAASTHPMYTQRTPEIRIPSASLEGDGPHKLLMRFYAPVGGDENPSSLNTSRIIMGAKSRGLTSFVSHLNLGNDGMPSGWVATYGDDSAGVADPEAPAGRRSHATFATEEALVMRVRLTGTDKLADWVGTYKTYLRCQQIGGSAGESTVKLRIGLIGTAISDPKWDTEQVTLTAVGEGIEVLDLGVISLPFTPMTDTDNTALNLYFEIHASCATGEGASVNLNLYDLVLIPIDEYALELDDPVTNSELGTSALRGYQLIEIDSGVLRDRTIKRHNDGTNLIPLETWSRRGAPPTLQPNLAYRFYFLMLHYPQGGSWGSPPLMASLGMQLTIELYGVRQYAMLIGND